MNAELRTPESGETSRSDHPLSRLRTRYHLFLSLLIAFYVVLLGWFLISTDYIPYTFDNNESYSTLVHATNLYKFGVSKSIGLADEAFSPHPDAHPYVHTHQGNFPRIFGYILYVFGARSVRSQIVVATFTIGILIIFMAFHYFSKIADSLFALIICVVFLSDYILFLQWHPNTYRTWYTFFIFSSLLCAHGLWSGRHRTWVGLTILNYAALFYFEYVFVMFVSVFVGLYTALLHYRTPKRIFVTWFTMACGGVIGIAVLMGQLIGYLGWENLAKDFYLVHIARNNAESIPQIQTVLREFYLNHNIAFWFNVVDTTQYRTVGYFFRSLFTFGFQVFSPFFSLLILIVAGGWLVGFVTFDRIRACMETIAGLLSENVSLRLHRWIRAIGLLGKECFFRLYVLTVTVGWGLGLVAISRLRKSVESSSEIESVRPDFLRRFRGAVAFILLLVSSYLFMATLALGQSTVGIPPTQESVLLRSLYGAYGWHRTAFILLSSLASSFAVVRLAIGRWAGFDRIPLVRLICTVVLFSAVSYLMQMQEALYDQDYRLVWYDLLVSWIPMWLTKICVFVAGTIAVALATSGSEKILSANGGSPLSGIARYLFSASVAYVIVYWVSTGYIITGYLIRYAPFIVYFIDTLIAVAIYVLVTVFVGAGARLRKGLPGQIGGEPAPRSDNTARSGEVALPGSFGASSGVAALSGGLLLILLLLWANTQFAYFTYLPPDRMSSLWSTLSQPRYKGRSFVVNNYAAPVATYTNQWAYYDQRLFRGGFTLTDSGYSVDQDTTTYLWLADRKTNADYKRPEYYLCMSPDTMRTILTRVKTPSGSYRNCSGQGILENAQSNTKYPLKHRIVDIDRKADAWAILKLDWDFPPYLSPLPGSDAGRRVEIDLTETRRKTRVTVNYIYAHQEGRKESNSLIRLYVRGGDGAWKHLSEQSNKRTFLLPSDFRGQIKASVTPRSATKAGAEYFSGTYDVAPR